MCFELGNFLNSTIATYSKVRFFINSLRHVFNAFRRYFVFSHKKYYFDLMSVLNDGC